MKDAEKNPFDLFGDPLDQALWRNEPELHKDRAQSFLGANRDLTRLEVVFQGHQPLAKKELSQPVIGVIGSGEDDATIIEVDGLLHFSVHHLENARLASLANLSNEGWDGLAGNLSFNFQLCYHLVHRSSSLNKVKFMTPANIVKAADWTAIIGPSFKTCASNGPKTGARAVLAGVGDRLTHRCTDLAQRRAVG